MSDLAPHGRTPRVLPTAAACLLAALTACSTLPPAALRRLEVFDTYVDALAESYPFFAHKHVDWDDMVRSYRAAVPHTANQSEFWHLLAGLLSELDDPHVSLEVPSTGWVADGSPAPSLLDLPGLRWFRHGREVYVTRFPAGQEPTPPAHLPESDRSMPLVERIDGASVMPSLFDVLARGEPGSRAELQLRWRDGTRTHHVLQRPAKGRQRPPVVVPVGGVTLADGPVSIRDAELGGKAHVELADGVARLRIRSFDADARHASPQEVRDHFAACMAKAKTADALLVDLVDNAGGHADIALMVVRHLIDSPLELVHGTVDRTSWFGLFNLRQYTSTMLVPEPPTFAGPVVVLTSANTASAAELVARSLQRTGRAAVVGENTNGAEAGIEEVRGPDGSVLRFGRLRWRDTLGRGFQGDGVVPDVAVVLDLDAVRSEGSYETVRRAWYARAVDAAVDRLQAMRTARREKGATPDSDDGR